jgi:hypothetical protein
MLMFRVEQIQGIAEKAARRIVLYRSPPDAGSISLIRDAVRDAYDLGRKHAAEEISLSILESAGILPGEDEPEELDDMQKHFRECATIAYPESERKI